jgi:ACS family tartrate transporter-like MFS transporter
MNQDLGLTPAIFGFGAGIFFIGYILFEIPSNLALQRFGARIWIVRIMISWGIVAAGMSLVSGPIGFYAMRFLLGVAEAGFFPGIILYLTYWFPARERARIVSWFMVAVPLATVIGGPLSGVLLGLDGVGGLKGWQWLFIIEAIPAVLLGVAVLVLLDEKPEHANWLTPNERKELGAALKMSVKAARKNGYTQLEQALTKPRVLALGLLYFLIVVGLYGIGFWMPQVIKLYGLTNLEVGLLTAVPYICASIATVLWGSHSDVTGERAWHVALPLLIAAAGFVWSAYTQTLLLTMVALSIATAGIYAAIGSFWSLPTAILSGTAAAAGLALVNSIGNSADLWGQRSSAGSSRRLGASPAPCSFSLAHLCSPGCSRSNLARAPALKGARPNA